MLIRKKHDKTCNLPPRYAFTLRENPLYQKKKKNRSHGSVEILHIHKLNLSELETQESNRLNCSHHSPSTSWHPQLVGQIHALSQLTFSPFCYLKFLSTFSKLA